VPEVKDAVVEPDADRTQLVGFVVVSEPVSVHALRERAAAMLPEVMVPGRFHLMTEFPLTRNGKVDRALLAAMLQPRGEAPVPEAGDTTARVSAAWREVLNQDTVPADVNFFDLGGQSVAMFKLQDALERLTGVRPTVVALFRHTTITDQVALIDAQATTKTDSGQVQDSVAQTRALRYARRRRAQGREQS
jgi:nonribosomal peptide synthetase protein BlmX